MYRDSLQETFPTLPHLNSGISIMATRIHYNRLHMCAKWLPSLNFTSSSRFIHFAILYDNICIPSFHQNSIQNSIFLAVGIVTKNSDNSYTNIYVFSNKINISSMVGCYRVAA